MPCSTHLVHLAVYKVLGVPVGQRGNLRLVKLRQEEMPEVRGGVAVPHIDELVPVIEHEELHCVARPVQAVVVYQPLRGSDRIKSVLIKTLASLEHAKLGKIKSYMRLI